MHISTFQYVYKKRRFKKVLIGLFVVSVFLITIIVPIERQAGGQITTLFDSLWWSTATLTSTGYGDIIPITVVGKFIGMVLQIIGVLIFGTVIALVSISLNRAEDEFILFRMRNSFDEVQKKLERVERSINYLIKKEEEREKRRATKNN